MISKYAVIPETLLSKIARYHPEFINIQKLASLDDKRQLIEAKENDNQVKNAERQQILQELNVARKQVFDDQNQSAPPPFVEPNEIEENITTEEVKPTSADDKLVLRDKTVKYILDTMRKDFRIKIENNTIYEKKREIANSNFTDVLNYISAPTKNMPRQPAGTAAILRSLANNSHFDLSKCELRQPIKQKILDLKTGGANSDCLMIIPRLPFILA